MADKKTAISNLKAFLEGLHAVEGCGLPESVFGPVWKIEPRKGAMPDYIVFAVGPSSDDGELDQGLDAVHRVRIAIFKSNAEPDHQEKTLLDPTTGKGLLELTDQLKTHLQQTTSIAGVDAVLWAGDGEVEDWGEKGKYLASITTEWDVYAGHVTGNGV